MSFTYNYITFSITFKHLYLTKLLQKEKKMIDSLDLKMPKYMVYCVIISCLGSFSNDWVIGSANVPGEVTHVCENGAAYIASKAFPDCLPMNTGLWGFCCFCLLCWWSFWWPLWWYYSN